MIQAGFFIIIFRFFPIAEAVIADAHLDAGEVVVAVMENECPGCFVFRTGQCHAIPEDRLLVLLLLQE